MVDAVVAPIPDCLAYHFVFHLGCFAGERHLREHRAYEYEVEKLAIVFRLDFVAFDLVGNFVVGVTACLFDKFIGGTIVVAHLVEHTEHFEHIERHPQA